MLDRALAAPVQSTFGERYPRGDLPIVIGTDVDEDRSGYGAVGFALLFPVVLLAALGRRSGSAPPIGRRRLARQGWSMYLLFIGANPFMLRVLLPWLVVTAPLLAVLAVRPAWRTLAIVLALDVDAAGRARPPPPPTPAEHGQDGLGADAARADRPEPLAARARRPCGSTELIGPTAPIGFVGADGSKEYPYFGTRPRRFIRRYAGEPVTPETMTRDRLAGLVFADVGPPPPEFHAVPLAEGHWLARPR